MSDQPERRRDDLTKQVNHLHGCVEELKTQVGKLSVGVAENTAITTQVRDILISFRVIGTSAKWVGTVGGGFAVIIGGLKFLGII